MSCPIGFVTRSRCFAGWKSGCRKDCISVSSFSFAKCFSHLCCNSSSLCNHVSSFFCRRPYKLGGFLPPFHRLLVVSWHSAARCPCLWHAKHLTDDRCCCWKPSVDCNVCGSPTRPAIVSTNASIACWLAVSLDVLLTLLLPGRDVDRDRCRGGEVVLFHASVLRRDFMSSYLEEGQH